MTFGKPGFSISRAAVFLWATALCILFTGACQPPSPVTPSTPTEAAAPSPTRSPTQSLLPTSTSTSTPTPSPTLTPTPTPTATVTPTETSTFSPTLTPTPEPTSTPAWPDSIHDVQGVKAARQADVIAVSVPEGVFLLNWDTQVLGFIPVELREGHPEISIALTSDGTRLAVGKDSSITIYALPGGEPQLMMDLIAHAEQIKKACQVNEDIDDPYRLPLDLSFSPDSRFLLSGVNNCILEWEVESGALLSSFGGYYEIEEVRYPSKVSSVTFSPDGKYFIFQAIQELNVLLMAAKIMDPTVCIWQFTRDEPTCYPALAGLFSWDGSLLVMGGVHHFGAQFYDANDFTSVRSNTDRWIRSNCMALSPDNRYLAEGSGLYGRTENPVILWNVKTWKNEYMCTLESIPRGALFSPRGDRLWIWTDILQVWDFAADDLTTITLQEE